MGAPPRYFLQVKFGLGILLKTCQNKVQGFQILLSKNCPLHISSEKQGRTGWYVVPTSKNAGTILNVLV